MQSAIIFPALVQALLSLLLLPVMGAARSRSMQENKQTIDDNDVRLGRNPWNDQATKIANNFKNQFEVPVLFFVVVAFALILKQADGWMTSLAWLFVLSRVAHTAVHLGTNVIKWRAFAFLIGVATLLTMWLTLAWRVWNGA